MEKINSDIPKILYKYRPFNELSKKLLSKGEVYFATTNELKDPLEKFFTFKNGSWIVDKNNKNVYLNSQQYTERMLKITRAGKNEAFGILSLCGSNKQLKMYEEYADNFKGICVGLDWAEFNLFFVGSHPLEKNVPRKVIYQPPIEIEEKYIKPGMLLEIFTTKSLDFLHEKEYRMFYTKGKLFINRPAIKEIIFGKNILFEQMLQVREWVKDLSGINFFIATPLFNENKVQIEPYVFPDTIYHGEEIILSDSHC